MIELVHLQKKYTNLTPLEDVNVTINDGDVISIIGGSGVGKSTLIRCINMIDPPTSGQILFNGVDITAPKYDVTLARRKMGMVFQSFNLFGHLTIIENIMLAQIDILKRGRQEAYDKGVELLELVGLGGRELDYPDQLSGGQKQRVAIARTLAMDPEVILFDEPTSALDPTMVGEVQSVIKKLAKMGKTMMIVTHEMNFARSVSNRIFFMAEGGIYEDGTPEQIFENPQKPLTKRFIQGLTTLELEITGENYDFFSCVNKIDQYCMENPMSASTKYRIELTFEELYHGNLRKMIAGVPVKVIVTYSDKTAKAEMKFIFGGKKVNPAQCPDEFSYHVLEKTVEKIDHEYDEGKQLNIVTVSI